MKGKRGTGIVNVLLRVIYVLLALLFIAGIWIGNNELDFNPNYYFLNPVSTFTGALLGALITGGLAIHINKRENNRIKEKEDNDSTKTTKFIDHYAELMLFEHSVIVGCWEKKSSIPHPWEDVEFGEDAQGNEQPLWFPPPEEEAEYEKQTDPLKRVIRASAKNYIDYSNKLMELKVDSLDLKSLDQYLGTVSKLQIMILPIMKDVSESENIQIDMEHMKRIEEIVQELTLEE